MRVIRKYLFVALLSARSNVVYLAESMSRVIFLGVILYILTSLWRVVFKHCNSAQLGDLSLQQMVWYLTATEAFVLSAPRVSTAVDLDVRSGAIVSYLQRPVSYPLYSLASNLGERSLRFVVNFLVGALVASLMVGVPHFNLGGFALYLLSLPLALVVDFLGLFLIGLGAFWLEDTNGIFILYSRFTNMLGGMLFPLTLFPDMFRRVLEWLPFSAVIYGPARMLVAPSNHDFLLVVARQSVGLLLLSVLVAIVYDRASKRIFANGG